MSQRRNRNRKSFQLEMLEGRLAPSAAGIASALHHHGTRVEHAGRAAHISVVQQSKVQAAAHNALDDKGKGGHGKDDGAGHNALDDKGKGGHGKDDGAGHR